MNETQIYLPTNFAETHEAALISYLRGRLTDESWRLLFQAMDMLDGAEVLVQGHTLTFRQLHREQVEMPYSEQYLQRLLNLADVGAESPALWAEYARQIAVDVRGRFGRSPQARILLAYHLYWWNSFARGYAFEVEIFRDLQASNVRFEAHDLLDAQQRFSVNDLVIDELAGDIKTSLYFVQLSTQSDHDFYIVRLFVKGQSYTIVTLLQADIWPLFNGDTIDGTWETFARLLTQPVKIETQSFTFVALDYKEWKQRVLRRQGGAHE